VRNDRFYNHAIVFATVLVAVLLEGAGSDAL